MSSLLQLPKARIVEPEETAVDRKRLDKHVPTAMNTHARTAELLEMVFSAVQVVRDTPYVVKQSRQFFPVHLV